jgi:hypothetical protein
MKARTARRLMGAALLLATVAMPAAAQSLALGKGGYFEARGVNVLVFSNWYDGLFADSKISGIEIVQQDVRTATNGDVRLSAAIVASWARYAEAVDEQGEPIEVVDRLKDRVTAAAGRQHDEPLSFITDPELFGDLAADERFTGPYLDALNSLHDNGSRATLQMLVG